MHAVSAASGLRNSRAQAGQCPSYRPSRLGHDQVTMFHFDNAPLLTLLRKSVLIHVPFDGSCASGERIDGEGWGSQKTKGAI
jgi:hypothetical protein